MPANQYGFSLAEALGDAERIKGARMTNELNQLKLDDHKAAKSRNALLAPMRGAAVEGDSQARNFIMKIDPENGPKFIKSLQEADKGRIELMEKNVDVFGERSAAILQTLDQDPEGAMGMYKEWYQSAPPEFKKTMPTTNIKAWLEQSMAKATAMDQAIAEHKTLTFGSEQLLTKGGKILERTTKPKTAAEIKAENENNSVPNTEIKTIAQLINTTMGGEFRIAPDGELKFVGLSDEENRTAMAALTRAVELRKELGPGSQAKAAQMAMEEMGRQFPKPKSALNGGSASAANPYERKPTSKFKVVNGQIVPL